MAQIYKTFTKTDLINKATTPVTPAQKQKAMTVLAKFITLFKTKHL
jgi:hypothetical protein